MNSGMKNSNRAVRYSLHPGFAREKAAISNLQKKTGRTLEQWIELVNTQGDMKVKEKKEWLKTQHHLTTSDAGWIVERAEGKGGAENYNPEAFVEAMFAGRKAHLRPLYEYLLERAFCLGPDVKACPCQTIVPLYRNHVFAQIKPTTQTRIDLGFALQDTKVQGKLIDTGGRNKGDRITHRIPLSSLDNVDDEVWQWMQVAYELDKK